MSDVQIAIIGQQDTQAVLAVPGIQGPAGPSWPSGGTTAQVLAKQSNANSDFVWQQISDASVASGAAIALTKLATGALPSGITVGSGNIVDGTMARIIALEAKVAALEDQDVMLLEG